MGISENANILLGKIHASKCQQVIDRKNNVNNLKYISIEGEEVDDGSHDNYLIWHNAINELLSEGLLKETKNPDVFSAT